MIVLVWVLIKALIFILTDFMNSIKQKMKKSPLLAKIKFEPTFFQVLWRFAFSLPLQGEAGGKGGRSLPFRPPSPLMKSVRIFSNTLRQLENPSAGSPSARARQPILGAKLNFLSLPAGRQVCSAKRNARSGLLSLKKQQYLIRIN